MKSPMPVSTRAQMWDPFDPAAGGAGLCVASIASTLAGARPGVAVYRGIPPDRMGPYSGVGRPPTQYPMLAHASTSKGDPMADGAEISLKEDGPILVSGDFTLTGEDGQPFTDLNPTIALCRCGLSANKPFCDGSHSAQGWSSK